jgi:hypothetical protein
MLPLQYSYFSARNVSITDIFNCCKARLSLVVIETFLAEKYEYCKGNMIKFSEVFEDFKSWLSPDEIYSWTKIRFGKELPPKFPKGRRRKDAQFYIGNIKERGTAATETRKLILRGDYLDEA